MNPSNPALSQSVHARLLQHARREGIDPNLLLVRFASERLLYRLSESPYAERFVLKGALLLLVWLGETLRPTRDIDLLGFGDTSPQALEAVFREVCTVDVAPDGVAFDANSVRIEPIRREDPYGGNRVTLRGHLGRARLHVQVDVGIGDAVSPAPTWLTYPTLLELPKPRLRAYRPETAIAEKVHAMATLGLANSRLRDLLDVFVLCRHEAFEGPVLAAALEATFSRRGTAIPVDVPVALTPAFTRQDAKAKQWLAFLDRSSVSRAVPADLEEVAAVLRAFLAPVLAAARTATPFGDTWPAGGPWRSAQ